MEVNICMCGFTVQKESSGSSIGGEMLYAVQAKLANTTNFI